MSLSLWLEADPELAAADLLDETQVQRWLEDALDWLRANPQAVPESALRAGVLSGADLELAVRIVGDEESRTLNHDYRGMDKPTNVLSFPTDLPADILPELDALPLGDLVICAPVMRREADSQGKALQAHWAHLLLHGLLHLLGHDHLDDDEAEVMEALEITVLARWGIENPYDGAAPAPGANQERNTTP